jgi:arsenate reductase
MAEAALNHMGKGQYRAWSAGSSPTGFVHPKSIETLRRHGIDPGDPSSKSWNHFVTTPFNLLVTVCDDIQNEDYPLFPGKPGKLLWSTPDPARLRGTEEEIHAAFDETFLILKSRITDLINAGA